MALIVREALPIDEPRLAEITRSAWLHGYRHIFSADSINRLFDGTEEQSASWKSRRTSRSAAFVAEIAGRVVGYVSVGPMVEPGRIEVRTMYVEPDCQSKGVGRSLWSAMEAHVIGLGFEELEVWTLARAGAVPFYESMGCSLAEEGQYCVGHECEVALCLRKGLGPEGLGSR